MFYLKIENIRALKCKYTLYLATCEPFYLTKRHLNVLLELDINKKKNRMDIYSHVFNQQAEGVGS